MYRNVRLQVCESLIFKLPVSLTRRLHPLYQPRSVRAAILVGPMELSPSTDHGRFAMSTVYEWSTEDGGTVRDEITLGPIWITTKNAERLYAFWGRSRDVLKDLTWPIVLALLGYWFQRKQAERDALRRHEETQRDLAFKRAQEERENRQQIWSSILPRFHELSESHYLPIVRSLRLITEKWSTDSAWLSNDQAVREYFFELLLFLRKMQFMREDRGQFFFSSRTAERVMSLAWKVFAERIQDEFGTVQRDRAMR